MDVTSAYAWVAFFDKTITDSLVGELSKKATSARQEEIVAVLGALSATRDGPGYSIEVPPESNVISLMATKSAHLVDIAFYAPEPKDKYRCYTSQIFTDVEKAQAWLKLKKPIQKEIREKAVLYTLVRVVVNS